MRETTEVRIYNSVMLKDVIQRNELRRPAHLDRVMLFIMDNIGNTFSAKTIIDFVKSQGRSISNESMYGFLRALQDAFIIHKVPRFDIKGKRRLETQETRLPSKYYENSGVLNESHPRRFLENLIIHCFFN